MAWVDPRFRSKKERPKALPKGKFGESACEIPGRKRPATSRQSPGGSRGPSPARAGPSGAGPRPGPSGAQAKPCPTRAPRPVAASTPRSPGPSPRAAPCPKTPAPVKRAPARPPSAGGQPCPAKAPARAAAPSSPARTPSSPARQPCPPKTPARASRTPARPPTRAGGASPARSPARSASPGARSSPSVTTARTVQLPSGPPSGKKMGIPWRQHQGKGLRPPSKSLGKMMMQRTREPQPSTSSAPCPRPPSPQQHPPPPCPRAPSPQPCPQAPPPCPQARASPPRAAPPPCPAVNLDMSTWGGSFDRTVSEDFAEQSFFAGGGADMTVSEDFFGGGAADMTVSEDFFGGSAADQTVCDFGAEDMTVCDFGGGAADQTVCDLFSGEAFDQPSLLDFSSPQTPGPSLPCAPGDDPGLCAVVSAAEDQARSLGILSPEDTRPTCPPKTVKQRLKSILSKGPKPNRKGPCIRFWDEQIPPTGPTQKIVLLPGDIDPTETTIIEVEAPRGDEDPGIYDEAVGGAPCPRRDPNELWFERMERGEPSIPPRPTPMQMPLWLRRRMTGGSSPPLVDIDNMAPTFTLQRPIPDDLIQWEDPPDPFSPPPMRAPSPPPACPYFEGKQDPFSPPSLAEYYSRTVPNYFNYSNVAEGRPSAHPFFVRTEAPTPVEPLQSCDVEAEVEEMCRRARETAEARVRGGPAIVDREVLARPSPFNREVVSICREDPDDSDLGLLPEEIEGAEEFFSTPCPRAASPQRPPSPRGIAHRTETGEIDLQATLNRIRAMREGLQISSLEHFFDDCTRPQSPPPDSRNPYLERCMARMQGYDVPFETPRRRGPQLVNLEDEPMGPCMSELLSNVQPPPNPCALRQQSPPRPRARSPPRVAPPSDQGSHYTTAQDVNQLLGAECEDIAGMQLEFEDFD